jgi:hypothetical protein
MVLWFLVPGFCSLWLILGPAAPVRGGEIKIIDKQALGTSLPPRFSDLRVR